MTNLKTTAFAAMLAFAVGAGSAEASSNRSIVDVATNAGIFNTLLAAATAADFADELDEIDGLTVFAPTDDAFAALPPGTVERLLLPENKGELRSIIAYHIVPGRVLAGQIPRKPTLAETLHGCERVRVERKRHQVMVDGVPVVKANIRASNGVVHVIGSVLLPARNCF